MPRPILVLGSGPDLVSAWRRWAQAHPQALTLVPRRPVAQPLWTGDLGAPPLLSRVDTVGSRLWAQLPPDVVPPPPGLDEVLAARVPPSVVNRFPSAPGLWANVLTTLWACRREGLDDEAYRRLGDPWRELARWLESTLPARIFDRARVYQYAADKGLETRGTEPLAVFQAGFLEGAALRWLLRVARLRPLTLFVDPRAPSLGRVRRLRQLQPEVVHCPRSGRSAAAVMVLESPPGYMAATARVALNGQPSESSWFVVDDPGGYGRDLLGVGGGADQEVWAAWLRFWRISEGTAARPETLDWLAAQGFVGDAALGRRLWRQGRRWKADLAGVDRAGAAIRRAEAWGRTFLAARTFHEAADYAADALTRQHLLTGSWLTRLAGWRALDEGGIRPDPDTLRRLATAPNRPDRPDLPLVPPELAPAFSGGTWVYLGADEPPAPSTAPALVSPGLARRLGIGPGADAAGQRLGRVLERVADRVIYGVGPRSTFRPQAPRIHGGTGDPHAPLPAASAWYRAHRARAAYGPHSGWVSPQPGAVVTSPSGLEQFGRCPLAFFFGRVLKVGEPDPDETSPSPSPALIGTWIHRALEIGARQRFRDGTRPAATGAWIRQAMAENPPGPAVSAAVLDAVTTGLAQELAEAVWRHGDRFAASNGEVEVAIRFAFEGAELESRLDRVDALPDGGFRIIDYKTGKVKDPDRLQPDNLQLALYREGLAQVRTLRREQIAAEVLGVRAHNDFVHRALSPAVTTSLGPLVSGIVERIAAGRFHPIPSGNPEPCRTCAFRLACPDRIVDEAQALAQTDPDYRRLWEFGKGTDDD